MGKNESVLEFTLNEHCKGFAEKKNNCWNYSIIAKDPKADVFQNEYYAGYIQGKLQGNSDPNALRGVNHAIAAARNNVWNNAYLVDTSAPEEKFPKNFDPSEEELNKAEKCLIDNYKHLYEWVCTNKNNKVAFGIKRMLMRLLGIYDGMTYEMPQKDASFEKINPLTMNKLNLKLGYRLQHPSFLDLYLINTQSDFFDAMASSSKELSYGLRKSDRCSAFVKRTSDGDIYWTHNSWCGFLAQSCTISYAILNDEKKIDFISQNAYCQGQIGSNMDFGFNGNGICFNETTHRYSYNEPKTKHIWICWRAAAAEMFAKSIDEFYEYLTADNSGTYLNGYMVIDAKTKETALIEMSYKRFVMFRSNGTTLTVTDSTGVKNPGYDKELISAKHIFGVNYPVSDDVALDLASTDNRPMRRAQFKDRINLVKDMESAKALITHVGSDTQGKEEPLSIFGRWDLGYGTTKYPKTIPDGAVDSKAYSINKVNELLKGLRFTPNIAGGKPSFCMLYGTPEINGESFVWSKSKWASFKTKQDYNEVPDRLEGAWDETKLFMD